MNTNARRHDSIEEMIDESEIDADVYGHDDVRSGFTCSELAFVDCNCTEEH